LIPFLSAEYRFPAPERALKEPNGLLAAGGDLTPGRILLAYRNGIFPWFSPGDPILWWSPDPRMVLVPEEIKIARSLAKTLRNRAYEVRCDTCFAGVIDACAAPRDGQSGTWITGEMRAAYLELHRLGHAHSVETWIDGSLAGGFYGVHVGGMFFGESMFTRVRDASKIALATFARQCIEGGIRLIDCQFHTEHLQSLGAHLVSRDEFLRQVRNLVENPANPESWKPAIFQNQPCRN
jgi:leucyl/phenylalanyl-tRNA--protein transferase